ncbi:MAG: hypothetical protein H6729_15560 [Deltaproteobacteria bacterium]|nr:hypothetical protein [Deltaproteobacteria bacterium]
MVSLNRSTPSSIPLASGCPFAGVQSSGRSGAGAGIGDSLEGGLDEKRKAAKDMLQRGAYERVVDLLAPVASRDPSGKAEALLGDAYFAQQNYADAEKSYRAALAKTPDLQHLRPMLARAESNRISGIESEAAARAEFQALFTRENLLKGPDLNAYDFGVIQQVIERKGIDAVVHQIKDSIGEVAGVVGESVFQTLTKLAGSLGTSDEVWTNWYKDTGLPPALDKIIKLLKLAHMREGLFENNLVRTYPADQRTSFYQGGGEGPPSWALYARTDDGSWNWLPRDKKGDLIRGPSDKHDPMVGAAMTRFFRNVGDDRGLDAVWPAKNPGTDPVNVLEVSRVLFSREGPMKEVPFLNMVAAAWIQFMTHDWVSHGDNYSTRIDRVPLPPNDPRRERYHTDSMPVASTQPDPTTSAGDAGRPATHINEVTHWWDGSQIYGSNKETVKRLRTGPDGKVLEGGKLYLPNGRLPIDPATGTESTGFRRNWWVGLALMHTLFAREHNAVCDMLTERYPNQTSDWYFAKARLINAAVMAKIHTVEWTPSILPNESLYSGMRANWYGLLTDLFDHRKHKRALSQINVQAPALGGIVGGHRGDYAKYALSEEFTSVYRLHSLLPDDLEIRRRETPESVVKIPLGQTRQKATSMILDRVPLEDMWFSFGTQHPGQLVNNNFPNTLLDLSVPGMPFQDLGAIDVYRDRERGIKSFNHMRKELGLKPIRTFEDLTPDQDVVKKLRSLYGVDEAGHDKVDDMDFLVGTLSEGYRPNGFGFGETLFQVFILNATWRLLGDRFFTDDFRPEVYTQEGLDWIDQADMKTVLLRHFPDLEHSTGLGNIKNAFEPWEEGTLDPSHHPLRSMDEETTKDPWSGDRVREREARSAATEAGKSKKPGRPKART